MQQLTGGLERAHAGAESVKSSLADMAETMSGAFTGAVEKVGRLTLEIGKLAGAAGIAAATYGVYGLNNALEQTQVSLAAIFNAQGFSDGFSNAMGMANDQIAKMKHDVKTLPGDLGQLSNTMKTIAPLAATGGADPDAIRKLAGQTMLIGGIMGLQQDQAAREMAMLLAGRAGSHNVLGTRLGMTGDKGEALNKADPVERMKMINAELSRFAPAADAFGKTFIANWTTLVDNVKYVLLAPATSPLFDSVKHAIMQINDWFDHNQAEISIFAQRVGKGLADAFDTGAKLFSEYMPSILQFAADAFHRIEDIWHRIEPAVSSVAHALRDSLSNGSALDKVEQILKFYGAVKLGGMVAPGLGQAFSMGSQALAGGGMLGPIGAGIGAGGLLAASVGLVAAFGELKAITDASSPVHGAAMESMQRLTEAASKLSDSLADGLTKLTPAIEYFGVFVTDNVGKVIQGFNLLLDPMQFVRDGLNNLGAGLGDALYKIVHPNEGLINKDEPIPTIDRDLDVTMSTFNAFMAAGKASDDANKAKKLAHTSAVIHVAKIEMTVYGNDDPSRIARRVKQALNGMKAHPSTAGNTPNFSIGS